MAQKVCLRLQLIGRIRLIDPEGREVSVPSVKAQGLLALLGTAPELRRPRAFLQDKLWSASEPEKGAASLRQLLTVLRRSLGPWRDALVTAPGWAALDPAMVAIAVDPVEPDWGLGDEPPEFATGLEIRDPEFEDWLRDQRLAIEDRIAEMPRNPAPMVRAPAPSIAQAPQLAVTIAPSVAADRALEPLAELVTGEIAAYLRDEAGVATHIGDADDTPSAGLRLVVRAAGLGHSIIIQVAWHDAVSGAQLAASRRAFATTRQRDNASAFDELIAEAYVLGLSTLSRLSAMSAPNASSHLLTGTQIYTPDVIAATDRILSMAGQASGGLVLAHRAQLRVIALFERFGSVFPDAAAEAMALSRQARERDPGSATVKAVASEVALLIERSATKAGALAEEARRQAPASTLARASYARALAYIGDEKRAHTEALQALRLGNGHSRLANWQVFCALTAMRCGLLDQAESYAAMAHELLPSFRPPLRYLAGLRWKRGDEVGTVAALTALKAAEPDFDLSMMADGDYPVASLRAAGLTGVARSGLI